MSKNGSMANPFIMWTRPKGGKLFHLWADCPLMGRVIRGKA